MMKKALVVLLLAGLLAGCGNYGERVDSEIRPDITRYRGGEGFFYLVDNNTGVVYLAFDSLYQAALSVMLNADGSPVTKEQLGLK